MNIIKKYLIIKQAKSVVSVYFDGEIPTNKFKKAKELLFKLESVKSKIKLPDAFFNNETFDDWINYVNSKYIMLNN